MAQFIYSADEIGHRLPQKYPLLLVDRVVEFSARGIVCLKNVTQNEEFFSGHFPSRKIMPGVLICEALAQTCALYSILELEQGNPAPVKGTEPKLPEQSAQAGYLGSINVKFVRPVVPGDQLVLRARPAKAFDGIRAFEVEATVERETVCSGTLAVTRRGASPNA